MAIIKVRGLELDAVVCKDSFSRRAVQYRNNIIATLARIGVREDQTDIPMENFAIRNVQASASWYFEGHSLHYSYQGAGRFVDNLYVVWKIIELKIDALIDDRISFNDFVHEFSEGDDVKKERKEAREALGLEEDCMDFEQVDRNFKILAKEFHPDTPNGDPEKFKRINRAHKILRRELE